jgi:phage-related holin
MISASYITESVIGIQAFDVLITEIMATFIAVTELVSILENVGDLGYIIPKKLLGRLKDFRDAK